MRPRAAVGDLLPVALARLSSYTARCDTRTGVWSAPVAAPWTGPAGWFVAAKATPERPPAARRQRVRTRREGILCNTPVNVSRLPGGGGKIRVRLPEEK